MPHATFLGGGAGLILSNHAFNRSGEILGTFRSRRDLTVIVGLSCGSGTIGCRSGPRKKPIC